MYIYYVYLNVHSYVHASVCVCVCVCVGGGRELSQHTNTNKEYLQSISMSNAWIEFLISSLLTILTITECYCDSINVIHLIADLALLNNCI